ncbi:amino acid ABC transporter permease [Phocea massiliensis]|uniref:amino acid ABC transporter permease n=1 Tax=Merdimmobilis hominis TaxID=2897707 RepID=UPI001E5EB74C|nr:amino acid ABC transporter permease [Merdimmobilis hominis]MCD4836498.1 amino acid ABC transporter permease [Merdimmobilis hominis]
MKLNFSFVADYLPKFISGLKLTIVLSVWAVIGATLIGILVYWMRTSRFSILKVRPLWVVSTIFIEVMRGTPVLLQILIAFSGFKMMFGWDLSAANAVVLAITLNSSVYVSEIIRAGIQAVDPGQEEAARCLGMTRMQSMRLVIMPQAIKNILPALGNEFVSIIKGSSMAYVLGVGELTYSAKVVQGATYLSLEPLMVSALFYLVLTFTLGRMVSFAERRMKICD